MNISIVTIPAPQPDASLVYSMNELYAHFTAFMCEYPHRFKTQDQSIAKPLCDELIATYLGDYYLCFSNGYDTALHVLIKKYMNVNSVETGIVYLDPIRGYIENLLHQSLPRNVWTDVKFDIRGSRLHITVGEDFRVSVYKRMHGNERWAGDETIVRYNLMALKEELGEYFYNIGIAFTAIQIAELTEDLLQACLATTSYSSKANVILNHYPQADASDISGAILICERHTDRIRGEDQIRAVELDNGWANVRICR